MEKQTYMKKKLRWLHDADAWPHYKRVIGCGVDCDADASGYFLNSDGSKTLTNDHDAALILLFSRTLAAKRNSSRVRCAIACWLLTIGLK